MDDRARFISRETAAFSTPHPSAGGQIQDSFQDNLDHLQALEQEVLLRLELADSRSIGTAEPGPDEPAWQYERSSMLSNGPQQKSLEARLEGIVATNRAREKNSLARGIHLLFSQLCETYSLKEFERLIVLLLFVVNTSTTFKKAFSKSALARAYDADENRESLTVGSLLAILCNDYRDQIASRRYFSVEGGLIREEIIILLGRIDETTNILTQSAYLHERIVRYILGDNCFYDSALKNILREKSTVSLAQVIMPDQLKKDVVGLVTSFASGGTRRIALGIDEFYGYGTGLVMLFYGPSGTGKTMLAKALANALNKIIFTVSLKSVERRHEIDDVIKYIFREARLHDGIVFFDECDDIFGEGQEMSRILLIEIEKASCMTILATNKPFQLDPSLERRITMKVPFVFPDETLRRKIWQELVPDKVKLAPDVDLSRLARNYHFNGGLIKNTLFAAISEAIGRNGSGGIVVNMRDLVQIADYQSVSAFDKYKLGESYAPTLKIDELPLRAAERQQFNGLAAAWQRLRVQNYGLSVMVTTADLAVGVAAVEATACACDLRIRRYSLSEVLSCDGASRFLDPLGQVEVSPLEYAFAENPGHHSASLFVDYDEQFSTYRPTMAKIKGSEDAPLLLRGFLNKLRDCRGFVFVVTACRGNFLLLPEFHQLLEINFPPEDLQIRQWEKHLGTNHDLQESIIDLVESTPMHLREIDFVCRQASVRAIMLGEEGKLGIERVIETLDRYREARKSPVLFGGETTIEPGYEIRRRASRYD